MPESLSGRQRRQAASIITYTAPLGYLFNSVILPGLVLSSVCIFLQLSNRQIGFVNAIPNIVLPLQILAALFTVKFGRKQQVFMLGATLARVAGIPLAASVILKLLYPETDFSKTFVFSILCAHICGSISSPCWLSMIGDVVAPKDAAAFWGKRTAIMFVSNIFMTLLTGVVLDMEQHGIGLGIILGAATLAGLLEMSQYMRIAKLEDEIQKDRFNPARLIIDAFKDKNFVCFITYQSFFLFANVIFSAFIFIHLVTTLHYSNLKVQIFGAISCIAAYLGSYFWSSVAASRGNKPVVIITTMLKSIEFFGFLTMRDDSPFWHGAMVFAFGGFLNAGVASSVFSILTAETPQKNRTLFTALFAGITGLAGAFGAAISGFLMDMFQDTRMDVWNYSFTGFHFIIMISLVSMIICGILLSPYRNTGGSVWNTFTMLFEGNPLRSFMMLAKLSGKSSFEDRLNFMTGNRNSIFLQDLIQALDDPASPIRYAAAYSLGSIKHPDSEAALLKKLREPDGGLAAAAAFSLGRQKAANAVPDLLKALSSPDRNLRNGAAFALGEIGDQTAFQVLKECFVKEECPFVAVSMADALGKSGDSTVIPLIIRRLHDTKIKGLRQQLAVALANIISPRKGEFYQLLHQEREFTGTVPEKLVKKILKELPAETASKLEFRAEQILASSDAGRLDRIPALCLSAAVEILNSKNDGNSLPEDAFLHISEQMDKDIPHTIELIGKMIRKGEKSEYISCIIASIASKYEGDAKSDPALEDILLCLYLLLILCEGN